MADPFDVATNVMRVACRAAGELRFQAETALSLLDLAASPETEPQAVPFLQQAARNALRNALQAHKLDLPEFQAGG